MDLTGSFLRPNKSLFRGGHTGDILDCASENACVLGLHLHMHAPYLVQLMLPSVRLVSDIYNARACEM